MINEQRPQLVHNSNSSLVSPNPTPDSSVIRLYIIQAKLDPRTIAELYALVNQNAAQISLCQSPDEAQVIVTSIRMRQRLERHLDWNVAKGKAIVTPDWLRHSINKGTWLPCGDYAAVRELTQATVENCPESDDNDDDASKAFLAQSPAPVDPNLEQPHYTSRYACLRPCPMECPNQNLAEQLAVIRRSRELEGDDTSALSYERTISVIKAYPHKLTTARLDEVAKLPTIGAKMLSKITEYINNGRIKESQTLAASSRFLALSSFTTIYGIGSSSARKLYDSVGLRTLDDLAAHFSKHALPYRVDDNNESRIKTPAPNLSIQDALALREDLNKRIPRAEVDAMHAVVMAELELIQSGCTGTIVGGYRRGKSFSNDVDIVISHPSLASGSTHVSGLCEKLVNRLYNRGMITHVMHLSSFQPPDALRTANWDTLQKALTVFLLPSDSKSPSRRIHRRLDLIFTAPETYWTAITGWTGSKMFERDLRLWAKERGFNFDSNGITRRRDSKRYFPRSEQEVFSILGLGFLDPTMRNADA
ncbi:DNA polymerase mu [Mycena amicta]|nr:DNA polymerase mu [Mycena amicta]